MCHEILYSLGSVAASAGTGCLGSLVVGSPAGALGGALFGGVRDVVYLATMENSAEPLNGITVWKVIRSAICGLIGVVMAWNALSLAGFTLNFSEVALLVVGDLLVGAVIGIGITVFAVIAFFVISERSARV